MEQHELMPTLMGIKDDISDLRAEVITKNAEQDTRTAAIEVAQKNLHDQHGRIVLKLGIWLTFFVGIVQLAIRPAIEFFTRP